MKFRYFVTILAFLFSFCLSCKAIADKQLELILEQCTEQKIIESCMAAGPKFHALGDFSKALKAAETLCEINGEGCSQTYFLALKISKQEAQRTFDKMLKRCVSDANYCDNLALVYEDRSEYSLALNSAKKYFEKNKQGQYPFLLYKYGSKVDAFTASLTSCKTNTENCSQFIRAMPDNSKMSEILQLAITYCSSAEHLDSASYECSITGAHYYLKSQLQEANNVWRIGCQKNLRPCLLLLGANSEATSELKKYAFRRFCDLKPEYIDVDYQKLKDNYCALQNEPGPLPEGLTLAAKQEVASISKNNQISSYISKQKRTISGKAYMKTK